MEIVHAAMRFTPTNVLTVGVQVSTRLLSVWCILDVAPPARASIGVPLLVTCWTLTEITRYGYYALHLLEYNFQLP
ncbi:unnamed protein product [Allacma fusca]|uniref:Very-long-chain (3R)-3-hydroxyacyl-CoA dehydratase n=1 Tax=Allacma fusca TaxID=39272 RepID=A0A8J2Q790_9HEXA|nr:unnamed protein product [Allacma fusca]